MPKKPSGFYSKGSGNDRKVIPLFASQGHVSKHSKYIDPSREQMHQLRLQQYPDVTITRTPNNVHRYFLANDKGFASAYLNEDKSASIMMVHVTAAERKKGYGKYLIDEVEADMKKAGAHTIYVVSVPASIPFWNKLGYKTHKNKPDVSGLNEVQAKAKLDLWNSRRMKILKRQSTF